VRYQPGEAGDLMRRLHESEGAHLRTQTLAHELRQQLNEAHAEIDRLNGIIRDREARALPPLMLWTWPRDERGKIIAREDEQRRELRGNWAGR
jgi:hypothetical protein